MGDSTRLLPTERLTGDAWRKWNDYVARLPVRKQRIEKPTKLAHAELAEARDKKDWALLWRHALPFVQMTVSRLTKRASDKENVDAEDLLQAGVLVADRAMREWRPLECAFSTQIANQVRWGLLKYMGSVRNHGIGSYEQQPAVISLEDTRESAGEHARGDCEEDEDEDASFDSVLTYEGVLRRDTQQLDGAGITPGGFGNPEDEAQRLIDAAAVCSAVACLPEEQRSAVVSVFGLDSAPQTIREYAAAAGIPRSTVSGLLQKATRTLGQKLAKSAHR